MAREGAGPRSPGPWAPPTGFFCAQLNQKNLSLTSRCQLFDQFQDRMSQHAVKLDFLRRVHRKSAPNRRGAHPHGKKTLKVSSTLLLPRLRLRAHLPPVGPRFQTPSSVSTRTLPPRCFLPAPGS